MPPGINGRAALVRNAADEQQNRRAQQEVNRYEGRFLDLTRALLQSPEFREWMTEVVECFGVRAPIFEPAKIHFLEGRRQAGIAILDWCRDASAELTAKAETEQIRRAMHLQRTVAAVAASHDEGESLG